MMPAVLASQHICFLSAGVIHQSWTKRGQTPLGSCSMSLLPAALLNMAIIIMPEWLGLPHLKLAWVLDGCFNLGPSEGQHTFQLRYGQKYPLNNAMEAVSTEDLQLDDLSENLVYSPSDFVSLDKSLSCYESPCLFLSFWQSHTACRS